MCVYLGWSPPCHQLSQQVEEGQDGHIHFPHHRISVVVPAWCVLCTLPAMGWRGAVPVHPLNEGSVSRAGHLVIHLHDMTTLDMGRCCTVVASYLLRALRHLVPRVHGLDPLMNLPVGNTVALTMSLYGCFKSCHKCCTGEALSVQG